MRAVTALAIAAALCAAPHAVAKPKPRKPHPAAPPVVPAHVDVVRSADGWRADLALDGPLLGWALPRARDGHRALLLLAGPKREAPDAERAAPCAVRDASPGSARNARLYRWRSESPERLELLGSDLPAGALDSADLDGDGEDELLLQHDGGIDLVTMPSDGPAGIRALIEDPEMGEPCCGPRMAWDAPAAKDTALRVALLGEFRTYGRGRDGGVAIASELAIPKRVNAGAQRVRVESPAVRPIGRTPAARMVFATEPEAVGRRRLRTLLLDPDGPAETRVVESWALFPEPERVVDSAFAMLNGSPVLIVTTTSAEKLSLLGEKALRVYPLGGDRTRAGDAPSFAATTGINLWQQANPAVVDLDRDGRDELVLAYWKGLKNSIAALEVYRGAAATGFAKPRTMSFDVENGEKGYLEFGADADGDGRPDLILLANKELLVFPGSAPDRAAEKPVETHPSRRIALPADLPGAHGISLSMEADGFQISRSAGGFGTPHLLDLDGDGRPEALFAGNGANGGGRVSIVFLRGSAALAPSGTISPE
jgi:hypothetical protein